MSKTIKTNFVYILLLAVTALFIIIFTGSGLDVGLTIPFFVALGLYLIFKRPDIFFAFFIFIGILKGMLSERVSFFQTIDLTVLSLALLMTIVVLYYLLVKEKPPIFPKNITIVHFLFIVILGISVLYTPAPNYGKEKFFYFLIITSALLFSPIIMKQIGYKFEKIFDIILYSAFFYSVFHLAILFLRIAKGDMEGVLRFTIGGNPIAVSRTLGVGILFWIVNFSYNSRKQSFRDLFPIITIFIAMLSTNSRGPLLSLFVTIIVYIFLFTKKPLKNSIIIIGSMGLILSISLLLLPEQLTQRYSKVLEKELVVGQQGIQYVSNTNSRFQAWRSSIAHLSEHPGHLFTGFGLGAFPKLAMDRDIRGYPHNIFIEVLYESGLIGLLLISIFFIAIATYPLKQILSGNYSKELAAFYLAFIFFLTGAQLSGDLNDNRIIWLFAGFILIFISDECVLKTDDK